VRTRPRLPYRVRKKYGSGTYQADFLIPAFGLLLLLTSSQFHCFFQGPSGHCASATCDQRAHAISEIGDLLEWPSARVAVQAEPVKKSRSESVARADSIAQLDRVTIHLNKFTAARVFRYQQRASSGSTSYADNFRTELPSTALTEFMKRSIRTKMEHLRNLAGLIFIQLDHRGV